MPSTVPSSPSQVPQSLGPFLLRVPRPFPQSPVEFPMARPPDRARLSQVGSSGRARGESQHDLSDAHCTNRHPQCHPAEPPHCRPQRTMRTTLPHSGRHAGGGSHRPPPNDRGSPERGSTNAAPLRAAYQWLAHTSRPLAARWFAHRPVSASTPTDGHPHDTTPVDRDAPYGDGSSEWDCCGVGL